MMYFRNLWSKAQTNTRNSKLPEVQIPGANRDTGITARAMRTHRQKRTWCLVMLAHSRPAVELPPHQLVPSQKTSN